MGTHNVVLWTLKWYIKSPRLKDGFKFEPIFVERLAIQLSLRRLHTSVAISQYEKLHKQNIVLLKLIGKIARGISCYSGTYYESSEGSLRIKPGRLQ